MGWPVLTASCRFLAASVKAPICDGVCRISKLLLFGKSKLNVGTSKVEIGLRTVNAANMFDFVADLINRDEAEGFLFRFDN